jgi:glutathione S-transferase
MKLYHHPISTTSRSVLLFAADHGIPLELHTVDLFVGEHLQPPYAAINPSQAVPVLEDGTFRLTESAAILRYLAARAGSPAYPADLQKRARVDERLDWFNTGLTRDLGYGFVYPQLYPHHRRPDDAQAPTLAWHRAQARRWLGILDESLLGPRQDFVCGPAITLADYFGAALLTLGDAVQIDYREWRNVSRWLARMKALPSWGKVNHAFETLIVAPNRANRFETL